MTHMAGSGQPLPGAVLLGSLGTEGRWCGCAPVTHSPSRPGPLQPAGTRTTHISHSLLRRVQAERQPAHRVGFGSASALRVVLVVPGSSAWPLRTVLLKQAGSVTREEEVRPAPRPSLQKTHSGPRAPSCHLWRAEGPPRTSSPSALRWRPLLPLAFCSAVCTWEDCSAAHRYQHKSLLLVTWRWPPGGGL